MFVKAAAAALSVSVVRAASVTRAALARSFGVQLLKRVAARASAVPRRPFSNGESQYRDAQRQDEAQQRET
jgi:hypothetical protein